MTSAAPTWCWTCSGRSAARGARAREPLPRVRGPAALARRRADTHARRPGDRECGGSTPAPNRVSLAPALAAAAALVLLVWWPRGAPRQPAGSTAWLAMPAEGVLLREGEAEDP